MQFVFLGSMASPRSFLPTMPRGIAVAEGFRFLLSRSVGDFHPRIVKHVRRTRLAGQRRAATAALAGY